MADDDGAVEFLIRRAAEAAPSPEPCPDANVLAAFAEGAAGARGGAVDAPADGAPDGVPPADGADAARAPLERHVSECGDCRAVVAAVALPAPPAPPGEAPPAPVPAPAGPRVPAGAPAAPDALTRIAPPGAVPAPAAPAPLPSGSDENDRRFPHPFGGYIVQRALCAGGMGVVYEAVHEGRRRREALKVLRGGLGAPPDLVERFRREVEAMANLTHDHIVPVYDSGAVGNDLYYTMPLLPGASLADVVKAVRATGESPPAARACAVLDRFGLPPAARATADPAEAYCLRVAAAFRGVADALAVMHAAGLVHRDIKPGNLLVDAQGRVLLADFGLVHLTDQRLTVTGQSMGTPAYMSPEQVVSDGRAPDGRSDVYAVGATLFELLSLHLPYEGEAGVNQMWRKLSDGVAPLRSLNPHVPEDLESLVGRCLERRREDRPAGAAALREDLDRLARGEPVVAQPLSRWRRAWNAVRRNPAPWAAAAAVLLGVSGWHFSRPAVIAVASLPSARVFLDGKEIATTPLPELEIAPGEHELRLERERFATYVRPFRIARGGRLEIGWSLQPEDPADPVALRVLAGAVGLQVPEVKVEATRSTGAPPLPAGARPEDGPVAFGVLFPRGRALRAPEAVRLWAYDVAEGWRLVLESAGAAAEPLATFDLAPTGGTRADVALDAALRDRLDRGGAFTLRLLAATGREMERVAFTVATPAERDAVDADLAALGARFPGGSTAMPFLETYALLARGFHEAAYDRAVGLLETRGERREVAQAALAALREAGLAERGWWSMWVDVLGRAAE